MEEEGWKLGSEWPVHGVEVPVDEGEVKDWEIPEPRVEENIESYTGSYQTTEQEVGHPE